MNAPTIFRIIGAAFIMCSPSVCPAQDSHQHRVAEIGVVLHQQRNDLLREADSVEAFLNARGVQSESIAMARNTLREMLSAQAWRDLPSRTTKRSSSARASLDRYLATARTQLQPARSQVFTIKRAEFEAWERANPEAAMRLRVARAESRAENAEMAEAAAKSRAADAESRARRAERRVDF